MFERVDQSTGRIEHNLRFELRMSDRPDDWDFIQTLHPAYFPTSVANALGIFRHIYEDGEPLVLVTKHWGCRKHRIRRRAVAASDATLKEMRRGMAFRQIRSPHADRGVWIRQSAERLAASGEAVEPLIQRIVRKDFGKTIRGSHFFMSLRTGLFLYLYDDRGLVVSGARSQLPPNWGDLSNWTIEQFDGASWMKQRLRPY